MSGLHVWEALAGKQGEAAAEAHTAWVKGHLAASQAKVDALLQLSEARTVGNTLAAYDEARWHLGLAGRQNGVMFMVNPEAAVRDAAQAMSPVIAAQATELSLNRAVYEALAAVDVSGEDAATRYYMERILLGYRLSGVDKDEPTRERIRALSQQMSELGMQFSRTVQDDVRQVEVAELESLRGLPEDYLTRQGVREVEGRLVADAPVVLTTDPPVMTPVMSYAADPQLRRAMYLAYNGRGYPGNGDVLKALLQAREEMAKVLGFRSWADLATVDEMMGSAANLRAFLQEVETAARETEQAEFAALEAFVRGRSPESLPLSLSDARYWEEQFRRERFDFDSQSVRPYFPYAQVEAGILAAAGRLFRVRFERDAEAAVWAADVKAFTVRDLTKDGAVVGRIYLDMHPREGKSKWFSECSLVAGRQGGQLPEASLVCNFPEPTETDPGLMLYSDVVTYFHEFGHLMHEVLGGRQRWSGQSGIACEGDFVEVPSQMLEEFFENWELVSGFGRHWQTGEPIPREVFAKMIAASAHGRALSTLTQVMYATYSLETHDRQASELDLDALLREGYDRFSKFTFVDGNRMYAAFTHLVGYTSNYYTYLYDKVMALEFFREFRKAGGELIDSPVALRYRAEVLEKGGSKPAREMVEAFLGRAVSMEALREWLKG